MEEKLLNEEELEAVTGGDAETVMKYKKIFLDMFKELPFSFTIQDATNVYNKAMKRYFKECANIGLSAQEKKEITDFIHKIYLDARNKGKGGGEITPTSPFLND